MPTSNLQVGDVVYAKPSTIGKYIITGYSRGFIGIVLEIGNYGSEDDMLVLDLFASGHHPLVFDLEQLFEESNTDASSNLEFFRHALLNRSGSYNKPVAGSLLSSVHGFHVNSKHFAKMEDPSLSKWKEHVTNCTFLAQVNYKQNYERNKLDPIDLNKRLDTLVNFFSQHVLTIKPISHPKLSL